jgi:hypothetical protein
MTGETGSYRFMAPEVFRHEEYTETVDGEEEDRYYGVLIHFYLLTYGPHLFVKSIPIQ